MDSLFSSRYPFSSQAKEIVSARKGGLSYDEVEAAKARVISAASPGELPLIKKTKIGSVLEREIFSYAGARVITALLQSKYLRGRVAVAESKRIGKYLHEDDDSVLARVAKELGVELAAGSPYSMKFQEYLKFAPKDVKYKLVNKPVSGGLVTLDRNELIRVIEEAARLKIEEPLAIDPAGVPAHFKKAAEEVRKTLPKTEGFAPKMNLNAEDYPPCIKELIARMQNS
ncbi:DNA primase large subunit PriL [uncultured archaeon]|nr:DNA primase large subunit PriL [uncultured archaeon]